MVELDCKTCEKKGCCTYVGWKVFFTSDERDAVSQRYGEAFAARIKEFCDRQNGHPIYSVTLPCPFFGQTSGLCTIYEARPLACRVFPVEIEPITGSTYIDQAVCPKRHEAKINTALVQISVKAWCEQFWQASTEKEMLHKVPIADQPPEHA